jgi:hypothetical protein
MSDTAGGAGLTTWEECLAVERGGSRRDTMKATGCASIVSGLRCMSERATAAAVSAA